MESLAPLGKALALIRKNRGESSNLMAHKLRISQNTLSDISHGRRKPRRNFLLDIYNVYPSLTDAEVAQLVRSCDAFTITLRTGDAFQRYFLKALYSNLHNKQEVL